VTWARDRPDVSDAVDAHSLYVEVLGELGVVGLVLIAIFLAGLGLAVISASAPRALRAVALAVGAMWLLDVAVEWLWEIPAATIPVLALAAVSEGGRPLRSRTVRFAWVAIILALAAIPAAEAAAQWRLDRAARSYDAGNCTRAQSGVSTAERLAPWQAAPHALAALCAARRGHGSAARSELAAAMARSPDDWQLEVVLAIVDGASGSDPRGAIRRAAELNPKGVDVRLAYVLSVRGGPREWPGLFRSALPMIDRQVRKPIGPGALCFPDGPGYWRWTTWTSERCRPSAGPTSRGGE
jgi:hypothetical protein